MWVEVSGRSVPSESVYFRERKFGRDAPGYEVLPYKMSVSTTDFIDAFTDYYADYVADDKAFGDEPTEAERDLRKLNWPPLPLLVLQHPRLLERFVLEEVKYPVVQLLFARSRSDRQPEFIVNTVKSVKVLEASVVFEGEVVHVPVAKARGA